MSTKNSSVCEFDDKIFDDESYIISSNKQKSKTENIKNNRFSPFPLFNEFIDTNEKNTFYHIEFKNDLPDENKLYLYSLSFFSTAEESVKSRFINNVNYKFLALPACVNYIWGAKFAFKYVLKKFKIKFENNLSFLELYELLPNEIKEYLQNDIYFNIETFCSIKDNHLIYEYYTNNEISFEHMKFFLRFIPRLKTVIFNINQNNLYI